MVEFEGERVSKCDQHNNKKSSVKIIQDFTMLANNNSTSFHGWLILMLKHADFTVSEEIVALMWIYGIIFAQHNNCYMHKHLHKMRSRSDDVFQDSINVNTLILVCGLFSLRCIPSRVQHIFNLFLPFHYLFISTPNCI